MQIKRIFLLATILILAGCGGQATEVAQIPTDTLAPLVSLTPRFTATIATTRTPLPTFTLTPSQTSIPPTPSDTFTPTEIPAIYGIISSLQRVNVREGPGTNFDDIEALDAGTQVEILGQNPEGSWFNVRLEDGREGWANATLVRVEPTPTLFPSLTPPPDLTALALGTPLPTALIGGGTITATPPPAAVTRTPAAETEEAVASVSPTGVAPAVDVTTTANLPVINTTGVFQTVTALAAGVNGSRTPSPQTTAVAIGATSTLPNAGIPTTTPGTSAAPTPQTGGSSVQQGVDVLAYCDNLAFGSPPPRNLAANSRIDVFWGWYARTPDQLNQHLDNVVYEVRVNGALLEDWRQYASTIRQESDGNYHIYWYVPSDPLPSGQTVITYKVTWTQPITDGYASFGPGTNRLSEEGTCTFTVQ